jgi:hypothetical protein
MFDKINDDQTSTVVIPALYQWPDQTPKVRSIVYPPADKRYGGIVDSSPLEEHAQEVRKL